MANAKLNTCVRTSVFEELKLSCGYGAVLPLLP
jgi:hypothetical protein